jgi:SAM-dependent methyltransferase
VASTTLCRDAVQDDAVAINPALVITPRTLPVFIESQLRSCHDDNRERNTVPKTLSPLDLAEASTATLSDYNETAERFWRGTRDHDVSQNIGALLQNLQGAPPFRILDFGCGPGRDLKTFRDLGHEAIGLDGAERFVLMARGYSGCEVWHQDFLKLALPQEYFDGVFANASLFHVPSQELPRVLRELWETLKAGGVLFSSNPRGNNDEGWNGPRYCCYYDWPRWRELLSAACFIEVTHYYRPPGLPRAEQPWLASVWRKPAR